MANEIKLKVNGIEVSVPVGSTILDACKKANINVPTLCYLKKHNIAGACKVCVVEVKGNPNLLLSCIFPAREGMEVFTNTEKVINGRKENLNKLLRVHNKNCLSCARNNKCQLQAMAADYNRDDEIFANNFEPTIDQSSPYLVRDNSKCIMCKRCVAVCDKMQSVKALGYLKDAQGKTYIGCKDNAKLIDSSCTGCGQCVLACPTGALSDTTDGMQAIKKAIADPKKVTIIAPAPSVRVTLGEEFNNPIGTNVEGKMVAALKRLGFNYVYDIDFGADLTIVEEANELVEKMNKDPNTFMLTSCCPAWVDFCCKFYPEFVPNLSSTKSPVQIMGGAIKTYWAKKMNLDPKDVFFAIVMPCTAKKGEILTENNAVEGVQDTDAVITVRELANWIRQQGISFNNLEDAKFDKVMGESTGAGVIFGATGGVMEAAIRTAGDLISGKNLEKVEYEQVRGIQGIKEATVEFNGKTIKVAVANGLANARQLLESVKKGEKQYNFIEVMACPGGCVGGGGTPWHDFNITSREEIITKRAAGLYNDDKMKTYRKSHKNPEIIQMYDEYFGKFGSEKAHHALHTHFKPKKYVKFD